MELREKEFLEASKQLVPVLLKKFHKYVKLSGVQKGKIQYAEDLVNNTIAEAYRSCMNPLHNHLSCIDLIRMKAKNIWVNDWRKRERSIPESKYDPQDLFWENGDIQEEDLTKPLKLDRLMEIANARETDILKKRLAGFEINEIAAMYGCSPGAVTMQIQRLKNKFLGRK